MWADCCGCSACLPRTGSPVAGFWAWCAAICTALASYLHMVGNERIAARRLRELDGLARSQIALAGRGNALQRRLLEVCPGWEPSPTLLLQLLEAAIAQGVAIPRALECIGACCGGACAQVLGHVSAALLRGVCWDEAWAVLEHDGSSPASSALGLACRTLRAAWEDGVSPLPQIHAAIEQMDGSERARIEQRASRLSVRLLLPMGLCLLPAFLLIAVVPTIMSFMRM